MHQLVVMGVAGCGKSTLAGRLAGALACTLIEGDDHHLPASVDKMRRGQALTDADREPWLDDLAARIAACIDGGVLSCSALKRDYRDRLRRAVPGLRFVYLQIDAHESSARVSARGDHLFPAALVASQFETLDVPTGEPLVLTVAATDALHAQAERVLRWLEQDRD